MSPYAFTNRVGETPSGQWKKFPINPVIRAIGVSLLERRVVDVALRIVNDKHALLNLTLRLEGRLRLEVHELRKPTSHPTVFARGRVYDAKTNKPRTWLLRILLKSKRRGGGAR